MRTLAREGDAVRVCHYCEVTSEQVQLTRDHIVPRHRVRVLRLQGNHPFYGLNLVPACQPCNGRKGGDRGWCDCGRCSMAWTIFTKLKVSTAVAYA